MVRAREGVYVLEVGVEVVSDGGVAPVVYVEWRLNKGIGSDFAQRFIQDLLSLGNQSVVGGVVGEISVVFVDKLPSPKSPLDQFRGLRIVPAKFEQVGQTLEYQIQRHPVTARGLESIYSIPDIIFS